ncbi:MAG: hypothetical protein IJT01_14120 [Selenomonadaceae bacterium]|nr:hypothetical protein [Selenomonadaceae bacterium]
MYPTSFQKGEGRGYVFNKDGNQTEYFYDIDRILTIDYDRNKVRDMAKALHREAEEISLKILNWNGVHGNVSGLPPNPHQASRADAKPFLQSTQYRSFDRHQSTKTIHQENESHRA